MYNRTERAKRTRTITVTDLVSDLTMTLTYSVAALAAYRSEGGLNREKVEAGDAKELAKVERNLVALPLSVLREWDVSFDGEKIAEITKENVERLDGIELALINRGLMDDLRSLGEGPKDELKPSTTAGSSRATRTEKTRAKSSRA